MALHRSREPNLTFESLWSAIKAYLNAALPEADRKPPAEGDPLAAEHPEETSEERSPGNDQ